MPPSYISPTHPGVEPPVPDEAAKTDKIISLITSVQHQNFAEHRHGFRGTHVKTQAILKGTLTVAPNLPAHLAQGIFAKPGAHTYPVAARFANEPSKLQDDRAPGPRGLGLRVFGVDGPGPFLDPAGAASQTQDFTFNNAPVLELRDVTTTSEIIALRWQNWSDPEGLAAAVRARPDAELQEAPGKLPNRHFLGYDMYSQSAYALGDHVVKYGLFPTGRGQQGLEGKAVAEDAERDVHARWVNEYMASNDAEYEFRVQLCTDLSKQPVEDASIEWDAPWETVAKVVFPRGQDGMEGKRRAAWDDGVRLNVWYGLEAHRPLGSVNRLRKRLYQASAHTRGEINGQQPQVISSVDDLP